jgi:hypothetical protein
VEAIQDSGDRTGSSDAGTSARAPATWASSPPPTAAAAPGAGRDGDGGAVLPVTPGPVDSELFQLGAEVLRDGADGPG